MRSLVPEDVEAFIRERVLGLAEKDRSREVSREWHPRDSECGVERAVERRDVTVQTH